MKTMLWVTSLILAGLLTSAACAGGGAPSQPTVPVTTSAKAGATSPAEPGTTPSPAVAAPAGPPKEIKIGWTPSIAFLPAPLAEDIGEYSQEGLKVTIIDFQGGAEVTAAMLGKSIDIAATASERPMILYEQNQFARNIMHLQARQAYGILVRKELGINPGDWVALKGKKLGISRPGSGSDIILRALLKANNLEPDRDVQLIAAGGISQNTAALEAKQTDGFITNEPALTRGMSLTMKLSSAPSSSNSGSSLSKVPRPAQPPLWTRSRILRARQ